MKNKKRGATAYLQALLDSKQAKIVIPAGIYLSGPLFVKSHSHIVFEDGVVIKALEDEEVYGLIPTRVAGIEMEWYPAILNIIAATDVLIEGKGVIDGSGAYWYNKYWGSDCQSGMRKVYDAKGLRWACDYDCMRPRNILISDSQNVILKDLTSQDSGFWNVHILYSEKVIVDGIKIEAARLDAPSTDGIDIDSSSAVLVENVITNCNDDSICIKSGRDFDGRRVNRPAHDITIRNCLIKKGFGITLGSEVSGGIYDINITNIKFENTDCGFRIKSAPTRGGYIKNIRLNNLEMFNVKYLFNLYLNWNPAYSICKLPSDYQGAMPKHYATLTSNQEIILTKVADIEIANVKAYYAADYQGIGRIFNIEGYEKEPISNLLFKNVMACGLEFGILNYVKNVIFEDCNFSCQLQYDSSHDKYDNR